LTAAVGAAVEAAGVGRGVEAWAAAGDCGSKAEEETRERRQRRGREEKERKGQLQASSRIASFVLHRGLLGFNDGMEGVEWIENAP